MNTITQANVAALSDLVSKLNQVEYDFLCAVPDDWAHIEEALIRTDADFDFGSEQIDEARAIEGKALDALRESIQQMTNLAGGFHKLNILFGLKATRHEQE